MCIRDRCSSRYNTIHPGSTSRKRWIPRCLDALWFPLLGVAHSPIGRRNTTNTTTIKHLITLHRLLYNPLLICCIISLRFSLLRFENVDTICLWCAITYRIYILLAWWLLACTTFSICYIKFLLTWAQSGTGLMVDSFRIDCYSNFCGIIFGKIVSICLYCIITFIIYLCLMQRVVMAGFGAIVKILNSRQVIVILTSQRYLRKW